MHANERNATFRSLFLRCNFQPLTDDGFKRSLFGNDIVFSRKLHGCTASRHPVKQTGFIIK